MKSIKLLCVAILGAIVGRAECAQQTVFDLPPNTPGLQNGSTQYKAVNGIQNQECVHVIVPGTDAGSAACNDNRSLRPLNAKERADYATGNIYFPRNGAQPTTPEAVEYSCANIDNRENSPITKWYMRMFGVIPFQNTRNPANDYIKAGYDKSNTTYRIIDASSLLTDDAGDELPKKYLHQSDAFEKNFKKIASTSVGRVLLYRLLIEIRRHTNTLDKSGCLEAGIEDPISIICRNNCRHLVISWRPSGNSFNFTRTTINFGIQYPIRKVTTIGPVEDGNYHKIILYSRSDDVGLFHEMIHWYHFLRHVERYTLERNANNGKIKIDGTNEINISRLDIGNYYWPEEKSDKWKYSAVPWIVANGRESFAVGFEEIRTILGSSNSNRIADYINGDDISENLYRSCNGQPLRFGHSSSAFYEDKNIVDKVASVCRESLQQYSADDACASIVNEASPEDCPKFKYNSKVLQSGIGSCKIPCINIESIRP